MASWYDFLLGGGVYIQTQGWLGNILHQCTVLLSLTYHRQTCISCIGKRSPFYFVNISITMLKYSTDIDTRIIRLPMKSEMMACVLVPNFTNDLSPEGILRWCHENSNGILDTVNRSFVYIYIHTIYRYSSMMEHCKYVTFHLFCSWRWWWDCLTEMYVCHSILVFSWKWHWYSHLLFPDEHLLFWASSQRPIVWLT